MNLMKSHRLRLAQGVPIDDANDIVRIYPFSSSPIGVLVHRDDLPHRNKFLSTVTRVRGRWFSDDAPPMLKSD